MRCWLLATLLLAATTSPALGIEFELREWKNDRGETLEARLVGISSSTAYLQQNGKRIPAPITRLSSADREYVRAARELRRRREWTLPDGSTRRGVLQEVQAGWVSIDSSGEAFDLDFTELSDDDREILARVFPSHNFTVLPSFELTESATELRQWTDVSGKKIEAELRAVEGKQAVLFFKDREWRVPLTRLSREDRDFIIAGKRPEEPETLLADNRPTPPSRPSFPSTPGAGRPLPGYGRPPRNRAAENLQAQMERNRQRQEQQRAADLARREQERLRRERERQMRAESIASDRTPGLGRSASQSPGRPSSAVPSQNRGTSPRAPRTPVFEEVNVYQCSSCKRQWESKQELKIGDKCPHCGVRFDYTEDEHGNITSESSANKTRRYRGVIRLGIFAVIAILGFLGKMARN